MTVQSHVLRYESYTLGSARRRHTCAELIITVVYSVACALSLTSLLGPTGWKRGHQRCDVSSYKLCKELLISGTIVAYLSRLRAIVTR
jgi:hypothetical protein